MKQNLIKKLRIAIAGLEDNSIYYNWKQQQSCNCGVVAAVLLEIPAIDLRNKFLEEFSKMDFARFSGERDLSKVNMTWKAAVQIYCPVTGVPTKEIFRELYAVGMTRDDLNHLEFLSNPLILKRSGISMYKKVIEKSWFGIVKTEKMVQDGYYYSKKNNLVKYLKAWVEILQEQESPVLETVEQLQKAELHAASDQNFERAAELRDKIAELVKV